MKVIVLDRELQEKLWGNGYRSIDQTRKEVEISDLCPKCGKKRGRPWIERRYEDGEYYLVSRWNNPCGHLDSYSNVLKEAESLEVAHV